MESDARILVFGCWVLSQFFGKRLSISLYWRWIYCTQHIVYVLYEFNALHFNIYSLPVCLLICIFRVFKFIIFVGMLWFVCHFDTSLMFGCSNFVPLFSHFGFLLVIWTFFIDSVFFCLFFFFFLLQLTLEQWGVMGTVKNSYITFNSQNLNY